MALDQNEGESAPIARIPGFASPRAWRGSTYRGLKTRDLAPRGRHGHTLLGALQAHGRVFPCSMAGAEWATGAGRGAARLFAACRPGCAKSCLESPGTTSPLEQQQLIARSVAVDLHHGPALAVDFDGPMPDDLHVTPTTSGDAILPPLARRERAGLARG